METSLRASSYEPGRPGWLGFRDLASPGTLFFTKISMCSYENRAGIFSHMNTPSRIPGLLVTKHFQLRMACKVADKSERGSTGFLGAFWTFFIIKSPIWTEDKIRPAYRAKGLFLESPGNLPGPISGFGDKCFSTEVSFC